MGTLSQMPPSSWWWPHCRVRYCWSCNASRHTCSYSPPVLRATSHRRTTGEGRVRPRGGAHPDPTPHGKAQSAAPTSRRLRFSVTSSPRRRGAQPPRQTAGHYGKWLNWANVLTQPPARLRGGLRQGPLTIPGEVGVSRQSGSARRVAGPPCPPARTRHAPRSRRRTRRP